MKKIDIQLSNAVSSLDNADYKEVKNDAVKALDTLVSASGKGADFLGWISLPADTTGPILEAIQNSAKKLRNSCKYIVVVGIGGSYLGAKAVIDALSDPFDAYIAPEIGKPKMLFAGQNISEDYLASLCRLLENEPFGIIVISKSGTTTEPAIAFRILRRLLEKNVGPKEARRFVVVITDEKKGALRQLADTEGYETFVIPDNVGGRFSVLSPVGLIPIAAAGFDVERLVAGAKQMMESVLTPSDSNMAEQYAAVRNLLYRNGKKIELLVNFNPRLHFIAEWWKQLYGESEGKEGKGIFPASVDFTSDLHSMGQWIQQGERSIFETVLSVSQPTDSLTIPFDNENLDGINFMADKHIDFVNHKAEEGTRLAHNDGGVPVIKISLPDVSEETLGQLIYFFEVACGISGYMLGVNPFDQPGVEDYKRNMFALLGKPGYEELASKLNSRLNS